MYDEIIKKINKARRNREEAIKLLDELKKLPDEEKVKIIESRLIKDKTINILLAASMENDSLKEKIFRMSRYTNHSDIYILVRSIGDDEIKDKLFETMPRYSYGEWDIIKSFKRDSFKVKYINASMSRATDYYSPAYLETITPIICSLQDDELKEQYLYDIGRWSPSKYNKHYKKQIIRSFKSREYLDRHISKFENPVEREALLSKFPPKDEQEAQLRAEIHRKRAELKELIAKRKASEEATRKLSEEIKAKEDEIGIDIGKL